MKHNIDIEFLGNVRNYYQKPKVKTSKWTVFALVVFFIFVLFLLYVEWNGDNTYTVCLPQGCVVEAKVSYWHDYCTAFPDRCIY